ncbi:hypothetical protein IJI76_03170 [Candidatus Saccharibacteria bacterium]|nr:hypothetical protein [Candidatus Saccharibacteria bacterium]
MGNKKIKSEEPRQVSKTETEVLLSLFEETLEKNIPGDIVEFGCYKGDTSVLFERHLEKFRKENPVNFSSDNPAETSSKLLWLYDSFEGLPEKSPEDSSSAGDQFKAGELLVTKREVVEKFKKSGLKIPRIRKGFFENLNPETDIPNQISFAFLDGDLYKSIKTSLKLVDLRIGKEGIIVVHDYNNPELPGSSKAVDEYLKNHPERTLEIKETLAIIR